MNRKIEMLIFGIAFSLVYFLLNFYVIRRFISFSDISFNSSYLILVIFLSLTYLISMILEKNMPNQATRAFYIISTIWFGLVFISFSYLIVYELINLIISINNALTGKIIISISLLTSLYAIFNQSYIVIKKIKIPIKNLKRNLKIVQITDLHLGTLRNKNYFEALVKKTNEINPDFVAITGDIVDGSAPLTKHMLSPIDNIKSPVFYVNGNHEIYEGLEKVLSLIKETKAKIMRNNVLKFKDIQIVGIAYSEKRKEFVQKLNKIKINKKIPSILLYHSPEDIKMIENKKIDLHLAGHTHGGQIFPFILLVRLAYRNVKGLKKLENTYQYTSMGVNVWGPPMRLFSRNELTIIELIKDI